MLILKEKSKKEMYKEFKRTGKFLGLWFKLKNWHQEVIYIFLFLTLFIILFRYLWLISLFILIPLILIGVIISFKRKSILIIGGSFGFLSSLFVFFFTINASLESRDLVYRTIYSPLWQGEVFMNYVCRPYAFCIIPSREGWSILFGTIFYGVIWGVIIYLFKKLRK